MPRLLLAVVALLVASSLGAQAQPAPALDYGRFLDSRFYVNRGTFAFGSPKKDFLLFPPPIEDRYSVSGAYVIRDSGGQVVAKQEIGVVEQTGSEAVMVLRPTGPPAETPLQEGIYAASIEFEGHTLASVPFSVTVKDGGDPFDPKKTWTLDGPWRTHAYFEHETERPDYHLYFNAWVGPDDMTPNTESQVSVRRNGKEVAFGKAFADLSYGWGRVQYRLLTPESRADEFGRYPNPTNWTIQDVTAGTYELVMVDADGTEFRRFTAEAGDGTFPAHANSDINADRNVFLTPRRFEGQNRNRPHSLYWIVARHGGSEQ